MNTITIPKNMTKNGDLVVISRKEYEALLDIKEGEKAFIVKRSSSFKIPKNQEKFYTQLDTELAQALKAYKDGKYYGPFRTANELTAFLHEKQ